MTYSHTFKSIEGKKIRIDYENKITFYSKEGLVSCVSKVKEKTDEMQLRALALELRSQAVKIEKYLEARK